MSQEAMTITRNFIISMDPPDCKRFWIPTNLSQFSNRVEFSPPTVTTSGFRFQGPRTFGGITAQHGIDEILLVAPRPFNDFVGSQTAIPQKRNENGRSEKLNFGLNRPKIEKYAQVEIGDPLPNKSG